MKVVILCGGEGTRMKEETEFRPKPLVLVGGKPILWHIMKMYAHYGFNDFVLTLGYKGNMIKDYFLSQGKYLNDFTLNTKTNEIVYHTNEQDDFKITFAETGPKTLTGERVRKIEKYVDGEDFMVTYGDGLSNIDISDLVKFHQSQKTVGTISGVHPMTRFGVLSINEQSKKVDRFRQFGVIDPDMTAAQIHKTRDSYIHDFINGGFMVFHKEIFKHIPENGMIEEAFMPLATEGKLSVYEHAGQWKSMDTYKDVEEMNILWQKDPFWKVWKD